MNLTWLKILMSFCVYDLFGNLGEVQGLTVHDRILINANIFSRPARRLWIHKVYPQHYFKHSWWGKCHKITEEPTIVYPPLPNFTALNVSLCGRVSSIPRFFRGAKDERKAFKYNAALMDMSSDDSRVFCGSSILSSRFVLTAAHCLYPHVCKNNTHNLRVSIGEHDLNVKDDPWRKIMKIADIEMHEHYKDESPFYNDIAVIKTSDEIIFNDFIGPVCLSPVARRADFYGEEAIVSGWGLTNRSQSSLSRVLRSTRLEVNDPETCAQMLRKDKNTLAGHICAGGNEDMSDACQGDSGGPLVYVDRHRLRVVQVGIVSSSYSIECGSRAPGLYVDIPQFIPWIIGAVGDLGGFDEE